MDFKYLVSVIIPVYNAENYLKSCLDSVINQTMDKENFEVLLVDDGSTDSSVQICSKYVRNFTNFRLFRLENGGPAKARNFAIDKAEGKYFLYLDSDDTLSPTVLEDTSGFFEKHYDEIDEVTYRIIPVENGRRKAVHYRYKFLTQTGVYDLNDRDNIYISQTTMNVVVKNAGKDNVKFDAIKQHEDQKYNIDVLRKKMKLGYVSTCEYLYERNPQSIVHSFSAMSLFEQTMSKWEEIFYSFGNDVPEYIQALYCNDILWKMSSDILLPYQLEGEKYEKAVGRISGLLGYVDDSVLINHPDEGLMNKYYFLDLKYGGSLTASTESGFSLLHNDDVLWKSDFLEIILSKFKPHSNSLEICGYLPAPVYKYLSKPEVFISVNGSDFSPELYKSSWCCSDSSVENNLAWGFRFVCDISRNTDISFKIRINGTETVPVIRFGEWVVFNSEINRLSYVQNGKKFTAEKTKISIVNVSGISYAVYFIQRLFYYLKKNPKICAVRIRHLLTKKQKIWLYHDYRCVKKDNGYYQFINDFYKKDGVVRYYVINDDVDKYLDMFDEEQRKYLIRFRSAEHKLLYLRAEKIITAYIEKVNYIPFFMDVFRDYQDLISNETVYLQHGVLHAHLPWKYSYDRLDITYEVVSSAYEVENFTGNYSFPESALIKSKMPRFDFIDCSGTSEKNLILFAPSWRKYLVSLSGQGEWIPKGKDFLESDYYIRTNAFLHSSELERLLEENDWYLDFKLHPIFSCYSEYFSLDNPRIRFASSDFSTGDYKAVITDYSSFVFDFVYLDRAVIYFLPDYIQFKAGLNDYRQLDIPFENGFGEFTQTAEEAAEAVRKIIENKGKALPEFQKRCSGFFFNREKNCREKIYEVLSGGRG